MLLNQIFFFKAKYWMWKIKEEDSINSFIDTCKRASSFRIFDDCWSRDERQDNYAVMSEAGNIYHVFMSVSCQSQIILSVSTYLSHDHLTLHWSNINESDGRVYIKPISIIIKYFLWFSEDLDSLMIHSRCLV